MLNELCKKAYHTACEKGWHDKPRSILEDLALVHSEISEAVEEARTSEFLTEPYCIDESTKTRMYLGPHRSAWRGLHKPEGLPSELADACIRIFDICGKMGIDLDFVVDIKMRYNESRPIRHGNKLY